MKQTIRPEKYSTQPTLYLAFELSDQEWKLGFTVGLGQPARQRKIAAGDTTALKQEIALAKQRFGLPADAPVVSCYEAGRDGFWLHRFLESEHITNLVVDSASIEVSRRGKHAKTDRLDVEKLLTMLLRYHAGEIAGVERGACAQPGRRGSAAAPPPTAGPERRAHALRQPHQGPAGRPGHPSGRGRRVPDPPAAAAPVGWFSLARGPAALACNASSPAGSSCTARSWSWKLNAGPCCAARKRPASTQVRQLLRLKGIGENSAWLYVMEFFGWRDFHNRREIGALAGLTPTPFQSGADDHEQGISKAGNTLIRAMAIEIAWGWLRHQPDSELSQWYQERFGAGSTRLHKIGIVALARKLLIALWHYLESGEPPPGATLKPASRLNQQLDHRLSLTACFWCERAVLPPGFLTEPPVRWSRSPGDRRSWAHTVPGVWYGQPATSTDRRLFGTLRVRRHGRRQIRSAGHTAGRRMGLALFVASIVFGQASLPGSLSPLRLPPRT